MSFLLEYQDARRDEDVARLRRMLAIRAMAATGMGQREIARALGVSQSAVSQQLTAASASIAEAHPEALVRAAAPILTRVAEEHGYSRLAVFGSVARQRAQMGSDIDLLVEAPPQTSTFAFVKFKQLIEQILGREIDLVSYGGLKPGVDDDIRREAVPL